MRGSNFVTTLSESNLDIDNEFVSEILMLCDGTNTRIEIAEKLKEKINVPEDETARFEQALPDMIENALKEFASAGLLNG
jgi:hypothetical protein